jgi:hypothetical protein
MLEDLNSATMGRLERYMALVEATVVINMSREQLMAHLVGMGYCLGALWLRKRASAHATTEGTRTKAMGL